MRCLISRHDSRISLTIIGISRPERLAQAVKLAQYPIPSELRTEPSTIQDRDISA
jgi:hypothetical protein